MSAADSKRPRSFLFWHVPLALSLLAIAHYALSGWLWIVIGYHGRKSFTGDEYAQLLSLALPCAILLPLSCVCAWIVRKGRRGALELVLALYLVSAAAFWYDVSHSRWFMSAGIATTKYWAEGNRKNTYITWWWYNDRCLWKFWR